MNKKTAIITINQDGKILAKKLKAKFRYAKVFNYQIKKNNKLRDLVEDIFYEYDGIIFIMALGIVVRIISPFVQNKLKDPAIVAIDTCGRAVISVLSGHERGANSLTFLAAACLDALPIVTTGCEVHKKFILGIGARKGVKAGAVKQAIVKLLQKNKITLKNVRLAATISLKKNETGLLKACDDLGLPLVFISKESIEQFSFTNISQSKIVKRNIGVDGVCEPCALLAGRRTKLISRKKIIEGIALAIAKES